MSSLLIRGAFVLVAILLTRWFWHRRAVQKIMNNIPGPKPRSFWTGNLAEIYSVSGWDFHQELTEKYGGVVRINALFGDKQVYVFDPKALHQIVVKDQDIFEEPDTFIRGTRVLFGEGILSTLGDQHRKQRKRLNPVFSIAHLRHMVPVFSSVGKKLRAVLESKAQNGPQELWMSRTALELVGQAGLGYSFDPLTDDEVPPYITSVKQLQITLIRMALALQYILPWAVRIGSPRFRRFIVNIFPWRDLHAGRDILDTMYDTAIHIYQTKKKALEAGDEAISAQIAQGKDIISILMKDNNLASSTDRLSEDEIIGQVHHRRVQHCTLTTIPATSAALTRTLHLLAQHQDIQDKLRQEIRSAQKEGVDLSYDDLSSRLEYLDAICRETLRLYPPVSFITRTARKDVVLTTSNPVTMADGAATTQIPIPAETEIIISIIASNRNAAIWGPDCLEWKPKRWLASLPKTVGDAHLPGIYSNLMTFGGGGRACIGFKFSQLEMKVILSLLVERFRFSLSDKNITWQMSSIAVPVLDKNSTKPQLPLKVELAK
ncbi:cytochrome P450 [Mycena rosella]|uniref:Cytochrome P450 n=1 Tax=Mycena rosella TaxID=1033263 RepID=A0AAD7D1N9_MYCRO|nr:cytochrome P450 [Mycena rosella]